MSHDDDDSSLAKRVPAWWRHALARPKDELLELLTSFEGQRVVLVLNMYRDSSGYRHRKSGILDLSDLPKGLVSVAGEGGVGREWVLISAILYVETEEGRRFGPF